MALHWTDQVDPAAVRALARAAADVDAVAPLAEQTLLSLGGHRHLRVVLDGELVGFGTVGDGTGELVVAPTARRLGIGRALLTELLGVTDRLWAHGDLPAARALAEAAGLARGRVLLQLRRDAALLLPDAPLPVGLTVRTFVPSQDEEAWLALNARAFAHHPEQGRWTAAELAARQAEPWFDPAGFFVAERAGRLVGFHWTKIENGLGEVYVVGVDPDAAGGGLGRALTVLGLDHLARAGVPAVSLYVDEDNPRALAMYQRLGFVRARTDVSYVRTRPGPRRARRSRGR